MFDTIRRLTNSTSICEAPPAMLAIRLCRLFVYGFKLMIWSKLFSWHRMPKSDELTEALLQTKSIQHLPPSLNVSGAGRSLDSWSDGFSAVNAALFMNLQKPNALSTSRHAHPAPSFRAIYLWDSAFIAQIWKWWDPDVAFDILHSVVEHRDGDRLQHYVADFTNSKLTQPPLLAWSLEQLAQTAGPGDVTPWLDTMYEPLRVYHNWLFANRQLPNGLFAWAHPYESGVENAPRFSTRDERHLDDTRSLAAPDFCAYIVLKCEALATMARQLGRIKEATTHEQAAYALRDKVNQYLWDDVEGLYFDRDVRSNEFLRCRSIACLLPLWAGIPDSYRAQRLLEHILDPAVFNTLIPLPSVAFNDKAFEKDMWRGPVWLNTGFAVIAGMRRYGFHAAASELAFRLCEGVYRTFENTGHFYEFYDPERYDIHQLHRKRGNHWKRLTLGARPVTEFIGWSGLVNTLVIDVLFGLHRTSQGLSIRPHFPRQAKGLVFRLRLPRDEIVIELKVLAENAVQGSSQGREGLNRFKAVAGDTIHLQSVRAESAELVL